MSEGYSLFAHDFESVRVSDLDPHEDAILLEYIARYGSRLKSQLAQRSLQGTLIIGPEDETPGNDTRYWLILKAARQENNVELLERAALGAYDKLFSKAAFARLTGSSFYEPCDSYSHRSFSCGRADGMTDDAVRAFCEHAAAAAEDKDVRRKAKELLKHLGTRAKN